jgi:hypothetical protein
MILERGCHSRYFGQIENREGRSIVKNFFLGVLTTLAILCVGGLAYLGLSCAEVRGDLRPSRFETYLMNMSVHASVRRRAPEMPNPVVPPDENLISDGKI